MPLNIETAVDGDTLNVRLSGDFDMGAIADFRKAVEDGPDAWRVAAVDLSEVPFMDSSGLQELVRLANHARRSDREVVLVQPSVPVLTLLELTGLEAHFAIRD